MLPDESELNDRAENTPWPGPVEEYDATASLWLLIGSLVLPLLLLLATERAALYLVRKIRDMYRSRHDKNKGKQA